MASFLAEGLSLVFSKRKYGLIFAALLTLLIPVYAILSDVVLLGWPPTLNPNLRFPEAPLVFLIAILAALGFTIAAYQLLEQHSLSKKSAGGGIIGAGAGGSVIATFATACTVCQPIWLIWLGLGSSSVFLVDYGIYIMLASIALLGYSIHGGLRAIAEGCKIKTVAE